MSLPPLQSPPLTEHQWLVGAIQQIYAGLMALDARFEHMENIVMASGADLTAKLDAVEAAITKEIQQLKDAAANAATLKELQDAVDAAAVRLDKMTTDLGADDPASPPTP